MLRRRDFILGSLSGAAALAALPLRSLAADPKAALPKEATQALAESPYVYVSPLKSDGQESRCHAEVWYAWIDESVVMTVSTDGWKSQALAKGLDRARIWVGDHGRRKGLSSGSEAFRTAPHFDARGERLWDSELLERLLSEFDRKYPAEIGRWRDKMRDGNADKSRVLIRYTPGA